MKKAIVCLLAAMLVLGMMAPTMAAEDSDSTLLDYYDYPYPPSYSSCVYTWMDENPKIVEELRKDNPPYWAECGYDSLDDMLYYWEMTESDYYDYVVYDRAWEYYGDDIYSIYEREYVRWVGDVREAMGAPRSGLAVMVNDKYISFPDAQPELSNGRTMLPIRALMEALGASVDFAAEGGAVTAELNGVTFRFTVGESEITVIKDNKSGVVQMDCNTYIKNDRTYVPVRFFSEAAGYDVVWDSDFQTAVILDREAIETQLNKDFTVINKLYKLNERDNSRTYKTVADISAVITSFSTLDGNLSARINMKATIILGESAQNVVLSCDLGSLLNLLAQRGGISLTDDELKELSSAANLNIEVIVNSDENVSYIKFPALMSALGQSQDAWLKIDEDIITGEEGVSGIIGTDYASADSIGAVVYDNVINENNDYYFGYFYSGVFTYDRMLESAKEAASFYGDSAFTKNGNSWSISIDRESYERLMYGDISYDESYYDYKELDVKLTITDNAGRIGVSGSFNARENTWGYKDDTRNTGTFSISPEYASINYTTHVDNSYKVDVEMKISVSEVTQSIQAAPPAGSTVISLDDV